MISEKCYLKVTRESGCIFIKVKSDLKLYRDLFKSIPELRECFWVAHPEVKNGIIRGILTPCDDKIKYTKADALVLKENENAV